MTRAIDDKTKAIFLDRDGVINRYPGDKKYVTNLEDFKFLKGALTAIAALTRAGYKIFIVSNQAGVAKGLYSKKKLADITAYMLKEIRNASGNVRKILYCLHTGEMNCSCRKPRDGLLKKAVGGLGIDKAESYMIGDSLMDIQAGKKFGVKTVLVLCGREKLKNSSQWDVCPDFVAKSLAQAAQNILRHKYNRA